MLMDYGKMGLKVGLEIHQQLATKHKLFCHCDTLQMKGQENLFVRRLRPTQSELGQTDPAALFEFKKGKAIMYQADRRSSCLVEADEEPPHELNLEAVESALTIALALHSNVVNELHVMRKIVIDGSNTTGFQRTLIVGLGGSLKVRGGEVRVQTVCLEEDAARLGGEGEGFREYYLDRLGVPLVEVALAPITGTPEEVEEAALSLGRLLRDTRKVARGLGTIRQDINISIEGGEVVEVKGIQKLDLISKVVEFEAKRQSALMGISKELRKRGVKPEDIGPIIDVTDVLKGTESGLLKRAIQGGGVILATKLKGFSGLLGYEPYPGIRLGLELADYVKFYGLGGIFHSDELPAYGITQRDVERVNDALGVTEGDAFVLLAGARDTVEEAIGAVIKRVRDALTGVPYETRGPTPDGRTRFSRPRPGAARMYPETDISPLAISEELLSRLEKDVPRPWEERIDEYVLKYGLSRDLALKVFDSDYATLFEEVVNETKVPPSSIAATLTETLVSLSREGLDTTRITEGILRDVFVKLDEGRVSKEAIPQILETISKGEANSVEESIKKLGLEAVSHEALQQIIGRLVEENRRLIEEKGERSFSGLMGKAMAIVRGRVDGATVSAMLRSQIEEIVKRRRRP